ncbi:Arginyl-tRNA synthetase [Brevinematales bacterium NS]|nr:arginine--tRNA ligase [Brevinematales bacterium]QJR21677.1 Arginyl-tRNA synthetase [Brevinematales bacterium NS]
MILRSFLREKLTMLLKEIWNIETSIPILYPDQPKFGDYSTSVAMSLAKTLRQKPLDIASTLAEKWEWTDICRLEVVAPGYLNFFVNESLLDTLIQGKCLEDQYGSSDLLEGKKILLEYVSANPTGPLHIGHGRWAALGDSLARLLRYAGAQVWREFYVNDAGNQIRLLRETIQAVREGKEIPENGYHGAYITDVAKQTEDPVTYILNWQKETLKNFGVEFDRYFSEKSLHDSGMVQKTLDFLKSAGVAYESEGALWLRTTDHGDDKDRVLVKSDGEYTYFAVDIAYHQDKIKRGFRHLYNILGADHHGYVKRMEAAVWLLSQADGVETDFRIIIGQLVSLYRNGEPVRMSKRTGDMITLEEVLEEIGRDALRYYMVMRKADTHLEFDIEEAKKQSEENPVFYVQYAHARICGILRNLPSNLPVPQGTIVDSPEARLLATRLLRFPEIVQDAATALEPHRIPQYLEDVASVFHKYYTVHRIITDDLQTTANRATLVKATKNVLALGLRLIGVSAPERM